MVRAHQSAGIGTVRQLEPQHIGTIQLVRLVSPLLIKRQRIHSNGTKQRMQGNGTKATDSRQRIQGNGTKATDSRQRNQDQVTQATMLESVFRYHSVLIARCSVAAKRLWPTPKSVSSTTWRFTSTPPTCIALWHRVSNVNIPQCHRLRRSMD
jgi:hypothetical protein